MAEDAQKAAAEIRQGLGVLCVAAMLVIVGLALDSDLGDAIRAVGILAALFGLAWVAYALLAHSRDS